jgi:hypothetical protein
MQRSLRELENRPVRTSCRRLQTTTLYKEVGTEETLGIDASSPLAIRLPFPFFERLYQRRMSCQQVDILKIDSYTSEFLAQCII